MRKSVLHRAVSLSGGKVDDKDVAVVAGLLAASAAAAVAVAALFSFSDGTRAAVNVVVAASSFAGSLMTISNAIQYSMKLFLQATIPSTLLWLFEKGQWRGSFVWSLCAST